MGRDFDIAKLSGNANYHTWQFAIKNFLAFKALEKCIEVKETKTGNVISFGPEETDAGKQSQAKSIIVLSIESSLFVHIEMCETAYDTWKTLQRLYEDRGLTRKRGLLKMLVQSKLEECNDMQQYIDNIVSTANKLKGIGFPISDEWLVAILLAGLTDEFRPFIMSLEASEADLSADSVISKLLDIQSTSTTKGEAFFMKKFQKKKGKPGKGKRKRKCFICGSEAHLKYQCDQKKDNKSGESSSTGNAFVAGFLSEGKRTEWYIDSGASAHMTPHDDMLFNKKQPPVKEITTASNTRIQVSSIGDCNMKFEGKKVHVSNILHVPGITANLLSVSKMVEQGNTVIFNSEGCTIYNECHKVVAHSKSVDGTYKLYETTETCMLSTIEDDALIWHRRLGHTNYRSMCKMRDGTVSGIKFKDNEIAIRNCETCALGKQTRSPFHRSKRETKNLLDLVHSDLMGPMETMSIGKARYILTFIDDFSKRIFCYFLKSKADVFERFVEFKNFAERQTERQIKALRTDNGTEYLSSNFENYMKKYGIQHQLTAPYNPESNGVAERFNRTIFEKARCLLQDAKLSNCYWAEAVNMAVYLINCSSSSTLGNLTPEEVWSGDKVDLSHLKLFGSRVTVHIPDAKRKKIDAKAQQMIFVGYESDPSIYRCIDTTTRKITISRNVKFFEPVTQNEFKTELISSDEENEENLNPNEMLTDDDDDEFVESLSTANNSPQTADMNNENSVDTSASSSTPTVVPGKRTSQRSKSQYRPFQYTQLALLAVPETVEEALEGGEETEWKQAMDEEMQSHRDNNTWTLSELPQDRKAIKAKWVFKRKTDDHGKIIRYKARLVAKGCSQKYGVDYLETYAPVVRPASIRFLIALAVRNGMKIYQLDAVTAFLQGNLREEIYMEQPDGYEDDTSRVCKLNKAIYGLKQAGREWNNKLDHSLKKFGFKRCKADPCIYHFKSLKIIIAVYVDDFLIFYVNDEQLSKVKCFLSHAFKMKDIGLAKNCLGLNINQTEEYIEIHQIPYVEEILHRFCMVGCKPVNSPMDPNTKLVFDPKSDFTGKIGYQELIGALLYLAGATRPDIAFAVNFLSRFNKQHSENHEVAIKRVLRYLRGTSNMKLRYTKSGDMEMTKMHAYSDADWGSDINERRSCSGLVVIMSNGAISWASKRQPIVALSSTEAEYIALSNATKEILWLIQLASEIEANIELPITVYCDNRSAIELANVEAHRQRSKHIDIRYHHIRDHINFGNIVVKHIGTDHMTADSLTKPVFGEKTKYCAEKMGLFKPPGLNI